MVLCDIPNKQKKNTRIIMILPKPRRVKNYGMILLYVFLKQQHLTRELLAETMEKIVELWQKMLVVPGQLCLKFGPSTKKRGRL